MSERLVHLCEDLDCPDYRRAVLRETVPAKSRHVAELPEPQPVLLVPRVDVRITEATPPVRTIKARLPYGTRLEETDVPYRTRPPLLLTGSIPEAWIAPMRQVARDFDLEPTIVTRWPLQPNQLGAASGRKHQPKVPVIMLTTNDRLLEAGQDVRGVPRWLSTFCHEAIHCIYPDMSDDTIDAHVHDYFETGRRI
jgi:hypothetical protein